MVISVITVALTSCSLTKRAYRNGYYVSWNKKNAAKLSKKSNTDCLQVLTNGPAGLSRHKINETVYASAKKNTFRFKVKPATFKFIVFPDSCGDIIILRNGEEIFVKALEISQQTIKYKRCNNLEGPLVIVKTENVFMIKYANGFKEVFKENPSAVGLPVAEKKVQEKKYNNLAIASFVIALCLFFPYGAPFAFGFGIQALREMKKEPEKYKGKVLAITGVVISSLILLIALILLLALL
ncbi:MAG: hypothetical protein JWO32_2808 [Bacteroidetes bacterium]|nr:hypothetical protein [Bacteroidota bacterium]